MFDKPFAVVVTTAQSDLMGAVTLAAAARAAGAAVQTPLAQSQPKRQEKRAYVTATRYVLILNGETVETVDVQTGARSTSSALEAGATLARNYAAEKGKPMRFVRGVRGGALPRAA
jgi:histidyl-tRNA synthetase